MLVVLVAPNSAEAAVAMSLVAGSAMSRAAAAAVVVAVVAAAEEEEEALDAVEVEAAAVGRLATTLVRFVVPHGILVR